MSKQGLFTNCQETTPNCRAVLLPQVISKVIVQKYATGSQYKNIKH